MKRTLAEIKLNSSLKIIRKCATKLTAQIYI